MLNIKKKIAAVIASTLVGAMLIGAGTFAIFTNTASNKTNTFTAGKVIVNLDKEGENNSYFTIENLAPGDFGKATTVKVTNNGNLDLRYTVTPTISGDLTTLLNGTKCTTAPLTVNATMANGSDGILAPGESEYVDINYNFSKDADDPYQDKSANCVITVDAQQLRNN